ncbi:TetR/AcrR family transcriptional regulator [Microbacterium soli]|uniref:HTH tetR-type domain-containing protein n=1 Tax=Microbacterium soli TaxID=446075 RepID=A0ABP7N8H6_9MICO
MMSTPAAYSRKQPGQRREEILSAAADIALEAGLERITVRAVAERIGVRPGLISHYFPVVQELVAQAFERAAAGERASILPGGGSPRARVAALVVFFASEASVPLSRLWLNARHLSRFSPALAAAVLRQEVANLQGVTAVVEEGIRRGEFTAPDAAAAAKRILMAVDATTISVNDPPSGAHLVDPGFVGDVAAWALGLSDGSLG